MFAECDKHYPSMSGQTSLATAVANITKPVTENNFGPSISARLGTRHCGHKLFLLLYGNERETCSPPSQSVAAAAAAGWKEEWENGERAG